MSALFTNKKLELTRRHFVNTYPPFNIACSADTDCLNKQEDLLLYVHIPFCHSICSYCFYRKYGNPSHETVERYLDYLKREIVLYSRSRRSANKRIKTLYIGGGTPTMLTEEQFAGLTTVLREHLDCGSLEEYCVEIMPSWRMANEEKLAALKMLGVTRISFGVESLNEELLRLHNRPCTVGLYDWTYAAVCRLGFKQINVDVMSGLVGETWESWIRTVDKLLAWAPPSISIYKTELFYNTNMFAAMRMGKAVPPLMSDDEEIRHVQYAHETLQRRGGYIVANCLQLLRDLSCGDVHYTSLWNGAELKGLGLSSHSCCDGVLHQNTAELPEYYKMIDEGRLPVKRAHRMSGRDRISQVMVYGLKNLAVNCSAFVEKFGVDAVMIYRDLVERLTGEGVLVLDGEWLRLAPEYYIFADDVSRLFFLPEYEDMMLAHIERGRADSLVEAAVS